MSSIKPNIVGNTFILLGKHSNYENLHAFEYVEYYGAAAVVVVVVVVVMMMMMCLPPRCSHRLRLLNAEFLGPLNTFYNRTYQVVEKSPTKNSHSFRVERYSAHHTLPPFRLLYLDLRRVE
jgi:hypothetical protein